MDLQNESTQRQPLLYESNDEVDLPDLQDEQLHTYEDKFTVREKLLAFACFFLLIGMCLFAYLFQMQGGGHHHGSSMDLSTLDKVSMQLVMRRLGVTMCRQSGQLTAKKIWGFFVVIMF
jgi:hypothetical protein